MMTMPEEESSESVVSSESRPQYTQDVSDSESSMPSPTDDEANIRSQSPGAQSGVQNVPPRKPDITLRCATCAEFIKMRLLTEHRRYHQALETLHYDDGQSLGTLDDLIAHKRIAAKQVMSLQEPIEKRKQLTKLDNAFDFLRAEIERTCVRDRLMYEPTHVHDVHGRGLSVGVKCVLAMGICSVANERWKQRMEDAHVIRDVFGGDKRKCFVGLYDGHNGERAALTAAHDLHHAVLHEMEKFDPRAKLEQSSTRKECITMTPEADLPLVVASENANIVEIENDISSVDTLNTAWSESLDDVANADHLRHASNGIVQRIIALCEENMAKLGDKWEEVLYRQVHRRRVTHEECIAKAKGTDDVSDNVSKPDAEISRRKREADLFDDQMRAALDRAHKYTDMVLALGRDESSHVRWSGCSTLCCVIRDTPDAGLINVPQPENITESENTPGEEYPDENTVKSPEVVNLEEKYPEAENLSGKQNLSPETNYTESLQMKDDDSYLSTFHDSDASLEKKSDEKVRTRCGTGAFGLENETESKTSIVGTNKEAKESTDTKVDDGRKSDDDYARKHAKRYEPLQRLGMINLANAGHIHAVLIRGNRVHRLSKDHTLHNPKERKRVLREGGHFCKTDKELRVNALLEATRGLGNHGDPVLKRCVITDPYTTSVTIDQHAQMLVLASHGVWEIFSPEEVKTLLIQMLPCNRMKRPVGFLEPIDLDTGEEKEERKSLHATSLCSAVPADARTLQQTIAGRKSTSLLADLSGAEAAIEKPPQLLIDQSDAPSLLSGLTPSDGLCAQFGSRTSEQTDSAHDDIDRTFSSLLVIPPGASLSRASPGETDPARDIARRMSERLTQAALLAGARDNVTVIVILLPGIKICD